MDPLTMAAVGGAFVANNAISGYRAQQDYEREKALMDKQNAMNRANALGAYVQQVQGMKMAGLNPAAAAGSTPISPSVSKGSSGKAEPMPMSSSDLLVGAQIKNIEAQTDKTKAETQKISGVDTKNVEADTNLKVAQKLLGEANTTKVNEEASNMHNINEVFQVEKGATALFGQTMAQEWQKQPWYSKLTSGQKMVVDDIAKGEFDLHPGSLSALLKSIKTNDDMSTMFKDQVANNAASYLTELQLSDPKVKEALVKIPEKEYSKLKAEISKIYKEATSLDLSNKWTKDKYDVYKHQDLDKLYLEYQKNPTAENLARWMSVSAMDKAGKLFDAGTRVLPAYVGGRAVGQGAQEVRKSDHNGYGWKIDKAFEGIAQDPNDPHGLHRMFKKGFKK